VGLFDVLETDVKQHYDGCWRDVDHQECAVVEVWRLANALQDAVELLGTVCLVMQASGDAGVGQITPFVQAWVKLLENIEKHPQTEASEEEE